MTNVLDTRSAGTYRIRSKSADHYTNGSDCNKTASGFYMCYVFLKHHNILPNITQMPGPKAGSTALSSHGETRPDMFKPARLLYVTPGSGMPAADNRGRLFLCTMHNVLQAVQLAIPVSRNKHSPSVRTFLISLVTLPNVAV